ncbi:hypothetical protein ACH5RR_032736 [Cinchona calisaya]|uniref:Transposase MuDR plant domain-containing protein n=1 Tax=Cinchona calisaya TaxID=153742 RepID=A0ABD2YN56_9GENT
MVFESKMQFKNVVDNYAVKCSKEPKYKKNDKDRMRVVCKSEKCGWFMHALRMQGIENFQIKTIGPKHKYGRSLKNKKVTATFLSKRYLEYLRPNLNVSIGDFQDMVHRQLNVSVTRNQVYRIFVKAKAIICGKYKARYKKLMDYIGELLRRNLGSTIELLTDADELSGKQRFKRLYICFEALKKGIERRHCVRHLHNTFKRLHPGEALKSRMWAATRSPYMRKIEAEIESLKAWLTIGSNPGGTTATSVATRFPGDKYGGSAVSEPILGTGASSLVETQLASGLVYNSNGLPGIVAASSLATINPLPKRKMGCYFCHALGHNKATCTTPQAINWKETRAKFREDHFFLTYGTTKKVELKKL